MTKKLLLAALLIGLGSTLFIWFNEAEFAYSLSVEDGVIETISALFYLAAFILCALAIVKDRRFVLAIVWVILSFVFLGEETSWFQRIFNYSVPVVQEANAQNEFNIHNLEIFQGGGLSGGFKWKALLKSQNLFRLGFFSYFLILPLLTFNRYINGLLKKIGYIKPDVRFVIVIIIVYALSFTLTTFAEDRVRRPLAETREMLYAFFIMLYVITYIWKSKKQNNIFNK